MLQITDSQSAEGGSCKLACATGSTFSQCFHSGVKVGARTPFPPVLDAFVTDVFTVLSQCARKAPDASDTILHAPTAAAEPPPPQAEETAAPADDRPAKRTRAAP